jgi:hypothetical protein
MTPVAQVTNTADRLPEQQSTLAARSTDQLIEGTKKINVADQAMLKHGIAEGRCHATNALYC